MTTWRPQLLWLLAVGLVIAVVAVTLITLSGDADQSAEPAAPAAVPATPTPGSSDTPEQESSVAAGADTETSDPSLTSSVEQDHPFQGLDLPANPALFGLLQQLSNEAAALVDGAVMGLAVIPLGDGSLTGVNHDELFVSASSAKAWWAAAALAAARTSGPDGDPDEVALAAIAEQAESVFVYSSDDAAGTMIDLAGGPDQVNAYTASLGMHDTGLVRWLTSGEPRISSIFPGVLYESSNFTTMSDAARFLALLHADKAIGGGYDELLRTWMTWSPRDTSIAGAVGSPIPNLLPPDVQQQVEHKAGWLAPASEPHHPTSLDIGIVYPPDAEPYVLVMAVVAEGANAAQYATLVQHLENSSCAIYQYMTATEGSDPTWTCPVW